MNVDKIKYVKQLCAEVSKLCDDRLKELKATGDPAWSGSPISGALRRRSMDLTRALADMRKAS